MHNIISISLILAVVSTLMIRTDYQSRSFVNPNWRSVSGFKIKKINNSELPKVKRVVKTFSSKYKASLIKNTLNTINIVGYFKVGRSNYGGSYWRDSIILKSSGPRHSPYYLERILHHEYSSILINRYPLHTKDQVIWNFGGYGGKKLRDYYLRNGVDSKTERKSLLRKGFLTPYSSTSFENDFNIFAEYIFLKPSWLKHLASKYPKIRIKRAIAIKYYCNIGAKIKCN